MRRFLRGLAELPILLLLALGIAALIKTFLMQAFYIPSDSMEPTLHGDPAHGDRVLVEKVSYRFGEPKRGQIIVFAKSLLPGKQPDLPWQQDVRDFARELFGLPTSGKEDYIKRIVAIGGDELRYEGKPRRLWVNDERVREPYLDGKDRVSPMVSAGDCGGMQLIPAGRDGCRVPEGSVFVMGDNRDDSEDSRIIGPIEEDKVVGRAFVIVWPPDDFRGLL